MHDILERPHRPRRRRWLRRSAAAACLSSAALVLPTSTADAQLPPPTNCAQRADVPTAGYGGVGGMGAILCYDAVDPSTVFIVTTRLWRRDANYNWTLVTQAGNSCVAGNGDPSCYAEAWAFQLFAGPGWYHTETINVSTSPLCSPCKWIVNSGELAVK